MPLWKVKKWMDVSINILKKSVTYIKRYSKCFSLTHFTSSVLICIVYSDSTMVLNLLCSKYLPWDPSEIDIGLFESHDQFFRDYSTIQNDVNSGEYKMEINLMCLNGSYFQFVLNLPLWINEDGFFRVRMFDSTSATAAFDLMSEEGINWLSALAATGLKLPVRVEIVCCWCCCCGLYGNV